MDISPVQRCAGLILLNPSHGGGLPLHPLVAWFPASHAGWLARSLWAGPVRPGEPLTAAIHREDTPFGVLERLSDPPARFSPNLPKVPYPQRPFARQDRP
jgi:hypothetical protein